VRAIVYYSRKGAHVTEYAILAMLLWRACVGRMAAASESWPWKTALLILLFACLYAAGDEFHQLFVPNREGRPMDVFIDTSGAAAGLFVSWLVYRWRNRRPKPGALLLNQE
jgi:VanZ family protein